MTLLFTVNDQPVHGEIGHGVTTLRTEDLARLLQVLTGRKWVFHDEPERSSARIGFQAPQCQEKGAEQ